MTTPIHATVTALIPLCNACVVGFRRLFGCAKNANTMARMHDETLFELREGLREIGFMDRETDVYIAILQHREPTVAEIAKSVGFSRTSVYDAVSNLVNADLVQFVDSDRVSRRAGTKVLRAADPSVLRARERERERKVEQLVTDLQEFKRTNSPHAQYFQGVHAMRTALFDILNWNCQLCGILSMRDLHETVGREAMDDFIAARAKQGMGLRVVRSQERDEPGTWPTSGADRRLLRSAPKSYTYTASMYIGDSDVLMLSTRSEAFALKISSRDFAQMQQHIFDIVWGMSQQQPS